MVQGHDSAPKAQEPASGTTPASRAAPVTLDSAALFAGRDEVRVVHRGQEYRLRITRQGKLILTK